jgi:uncharacterized protein
MTHPRSGLRPPPPQGGTASGLAEPAPRRLLGLVLRRALLLSLLASGCGGGAGDESAANDERASAQSLNVVEAEQRSRALPACPTPPQTLQDITAVQGPGALSPLVGQLVSVRGVVTADLRAPGRLNGFFIQQPVPDADPATSEGLFVFAPGNTAALQVGDYVQASGTIVEFKSGSTDPERATQLATLTQLDVCGPAQPIRPTRVRLPVDSPAQLEALEGMLVRFDQTLHVTETFSLGRFGELVLSARDRLYHPNNQPRLSADEARELNPRLRLVLDDGSTTQNPNPIPNLSAADSSGTRRADDVVQRLEGILSWGFDSYRVQPTATPAFEARNARPTAPDNVGGTLKAGHLNVLNYFTTLNARGANTPQELERQRAKLVEAIVGLDADILGLIEIENNGKTALTDLVNAVNTRLGSVVYAFRDAGVPGTDAIKVAVIYKPARVDAIGNPVVPDDPDFIVDGGLRPPVAQRFAAKDNGGGLWFVVNHLKSKGSCPSAADSPDRDLGQGCWNVSRVRQANALQRWVSGLVAASGEADVLQVGDFNAYLREDPIAAIEGSSYENLLMRLPRRERYSFVFNGEAGALDHAFASRSLRRQVTGVTLWHINADEPPVLDYNTEFKTDDRFAATPFRSSDHDPVLVGLQLRQDAPVSAPTLDATLPTSAQATVAVRIGDITALVSSGASVTALAVDWGDGSGVQALPAAAMSAEHVYTATGNYAVRFTLTDSSGQSAQLVTTVRVGPAPVDPGAGSDLFFSEYVEGSSNNKAIEIVNAGTAAADLGEVVLKLYSNGAVSATATLALTGTLAPGATLVICNAAIAAAALPSCNLTNSSVINFNGDDAITLERNGAVVDAFGQVGFDPGTAWTSGTVSTVNQTLRRKQAIVRGSVPPAAPAAWDVAAEWDAFAIDSFDGLGAR